METIRTVGLNDIRDSDVRVFKSLLPIIESKTDSRWKLLFDGEADISIVDADTPEGLAKGIERVLHGNPVVFISRKESHNTNLRYWLKKPIRTSDIVVVFRYFEGKKDVYEKSAKLLRWPSNEIIKSCLGSSRLCALLMRKSLSIERAVELSGVPYKRVLQFIVACVSANIMEITHGDGDHTSKINLTSNHTKSSIFSKLRKKIYSRV